MSNPSPKMNNLVTEFICDDCQQSTFVKSAVLFKLESAPINCAWCGSGEIESNAVYKTEEDS